MEVVTKKFGISSKQYFWILLGNFLKRRWWLLLFIWIMALTNLNPDYQGGEIFIVLAIVYPAATAIRFWMYSSLQGGRSLAVPTQYTFDEEGIYARNDDGTEVKTKYHALLKAVVGEKYTLLYASPGSMMIIPMEVFQSHSDRMWFLQKAVQKINNK